MRPVIVELHYLHEQHVQMYNSQTVSKQQKHVKFRHGGRSGKKEHNASGCCKCFEITQHVDSTKGKETKPVEEPHKNSLQVTFSVENIGTNWKNTAFPDHVIPSQMLPTRQPESG